jgi:hypothetical protein
MAMEMGHKGEAKSTYFYKSSPPLEDMFILSSPP